MGNLGCNFLSSLIHEYCSVGRTIFDNLGLLWMLVLIYVLNCVINDKFDVKKFAVYG